jgi:hypothetical protein
VHEGTVRYLTCRHHPGPPLVLARHAHADLRARQAHVEEEKQSIAKGLGNIREPCRKLVCHPLTMHTISNTPFDGELMRKVGSQGRLLTMFTRPARHPSLLSLQAVYVGKDAVQGTQSALHGICMVFFLFSVPNRQWESSIRPRVCVSAFPKMLLSANLPACSVPVDGTVRSTMTN